MTELSGIIKSIYAKSHHHFAPVPELKSLSAFTLKDDIQ